MNRSSWSWYHDSLDYVMEKGIINGMSATSFAPDQPMSRAQLVKTLWAMAGSPDVELPPVKPDPAPVEPEQPEDTKTPEPSEDTDGPENDKAASDDGSADAGTQPPAASEQPKEETPEEPTQYQFSDVPENAWFTKAVYWAQQNGVVEGYPDGTFLPDRDVTRQEMAAVLYRYAQKRGEDVSARAQLSSYQDAGKVASWAKDAMGWVCGKNIIRGVTETSLPPEGNATRSQVATILARYLRGDTQTSRTLEAGPIPEMEPIFYDDGADLGGN